MPVLDQIINHTNHYQHSQSFGDHHVSSRFTSLAALPAELFSLATEPFRLLYLTGSTVIKGGVQLLHYFDPHSEVLQIYEDNLPGFQQMWQSIKKIGALIAAIFAAIPLSLFAPFRHGEVLSRLGLIQQASQAPTPPNTPEPQSHTPAALVEPGPAPVEDLLLSEHDEGLDLSPDPAPIATTAEQTHKKHKHHKKHKTHKHHKKHEKKPDLHPTFAVQDHTDHHEQLPKSDSETPPASDNHDLPASSTSPSSTKQNDSAVKEKRKSKLRQYFSGRNLIGS